MADVRALIRDAGVDLPDGEIERWVDWRIRRRFEPTLLNVAVLHVAATFGHPVIVRHLLEMGTDVAARDEDGNTALHCACDPVRACDTGRVEVVRLTMGDVNAKNLLAETPLHFACTNDTSPSRIHTNQTSANHLEIVRTLLDAGADEEANTTAGWAPIDIAKATSKTQPNP